MGWLFWGLIAVLACFVLALANGFIAPLKVHLKARLEPQTDWKPAQDNAPFVGLALSGGGARAAVFAAAGIKALQDRGLLAPVTHVSSVSGGGFAASYLALHPMPDHKDTGDYFYRMQAVMAHDFFGTHRCNSCESRRACSAQRAGWSP